MRTTEDYAEDYAVYTHTTTTTTATTTQHPLLHHLHVSPDPKYRLELKNHIFIFLARILEYIIYIIDLIRALLEQKKLQQKFHKICFGTLVQIV